MGSTTSPMQHLSVFVSLLLFISALTRGHASEQLHIVLAHYHESTADVQRFVTQVLELPNIKSMRPSVFIYCKAEVQDQLAGLSLPDGVVATVIHAENVAREGETYLSYIIAHHHELPEFVLFCQAVPSVPPVVVGSLGHHNASIGMMSLGLALNCTCMGCHQGAHALGLFAELYALSAHRVCDGDFLGLFNGQFIVSKAGVLRHSQAFYKMWRGLLTAPENHTVHARMKAEQVFEYNHTTPPITHYLERLWAPIFGCLHPTPMFGPTEFDGHVCMDLVTEAMW